MSSFGFAEEERHGHTGLDPAERHQDGQEATAHEVQEDAERTGFVPT